jgi:hypothetical protein
LKPFLELNRSDLRVDRQELYEVGDEPPAEPRFWLLPIADDLAVPQCFPDNPTIRAMSLMLIPLFDPDGS